MNVSESETAVQVTAELPGMDEKDIQISLERDVLVISGEKKSEIRGNRQELPPRRSAPLVPSSGSSPW